MNDAALLHFGDPQIAEFFTRAAMHPLAHLIGVTRYVERLPGINRIRQRDHDHVVIFFTSRE